MCNKILCNGKVGSVNVSAIEKIKENLKRVDLLTPTIVEALHKNTPMHNLKELSQEMLAQLPENADIAEVFSLTAEEIESLAEQFVLVDFYLPLALIVHKYPDFLKGTNDLPIPASAVFEAPEKYSLVHHVQARANTRSTADFLSGPAHVQAKKRPDTFLNKLAKRGFDTLTSIQLQGKMKLKDLYPDFFKVTSRVTEQFSDKPKLSYVLFS